MLDRTGFGGGGGGGERGGGSGRGVAGPVDRAGRPTDAGGPELLCRLRRVTRQRLGCVFSFGRPAGPRGRTSSCRVCCAPARAGESVRLASGNSGSGLLLLFGANRHEVVVERYAC